MPILKFEVGDFVIRSSVNFKTIFGLVSLQPCFVFVNVDKGLGGDFLEPEN